MHRSSAQRWGEQSMGIRRLIGRLTVPLQIARRRRAHQEKHPDAKIISLGIGDTTEPIPRSIAEAMQQAAAGMATLEGYSGSVAPSQPRLQWRSAQSTKLKMCICKTITSGIVLRTSPDLICDLLVKASLEEDQSLLCRYGAEQGKPELREALCQRFYSHVGRKPGEIFVSDGSKCDIGRLQMMFGADTTVAVQVDFSRKALRMAVYAYIRRLTCSG